jgi:D-glycero-D-manno-heptose 1,7-bisphosphate phosphatase
MIEFHGKPFLAYLVEQMRDQGFERILLLLGYLPHVIQDYFGDGSRFGIRIDYSVTPADDLTGTRLKIARPLLDPTFMLCYCDNYTPLRMADMWRAYRNAGTPAMITVYRNDDGYTRSNVALDSNNRVLRYDRERKAPGLQGVDIGYAILRRSVLDLIPERDVLFEEAVYPALAERGELSAYVTGHRYYSVGSHERLPLTSEFLSNRPTIILDRDGVLNRKPPKAEYVKHWGEFHWMPGAKEALGMLGAAGFRIIIVSNQAGIARKAMTVDDVEAIHRRLKAEASAGGGEIAGIFYCPHHWDDGCQCRKPLPGMLYQAQRQFHFDLTRSLFIGDDERDGQAAAAAGCPFQLVDESTSLITAVRELLHQNEEAITV